MIDYEVVSGAAEARPWLTLVHGFSQNRRYFAPAAFRSGSARVESCRSF